jgi:hypothetical protein
MDDFVTAAMSGICEAPPPTTSQVDMTSLPLYHMESWAEGPRFAHLPEFIRKLAMQCEVKVVMLEVRTRLIRETVFFRIEGYDKSKCDAFANQFKRAMEEYQRED